ncbi:ABC transporter ATP-binding protein [Geodermatophilus sp. SYSU D00691]
MIEIRNLTKVYGPTVAVDGLTVTIRPGVVTGFLGPNGAGKSTTMRAIVGLDRPTSGEALVGGRRYAEHAAPLREVGAMLEARAAHPGRSALAHLRALAVTNGIGRARVDEVVDMVGLREAADRRVGGFSLGMAQRLGIAAALLGDPAVILLDEPVNGLDPDGIRWIRELLRGLAAEGRTVFISSHLMSEMALTADHLVILGRGRLIADVSMEEMTASATGQVRVRTSRSDDLARLLGADGGTVARLEPDVLAVTRRTSTQIAETALAARILLTELTPVHASLEDAYLAMTQHDVQFRATTPDHTDPGRAAA